MTYLQALILAIIEGVTEFLPISSTGHMVVASSLMGIANDPFVKLFEVVIQFGAILSVVVLYWKRFFQSFDFYLKLLAGVVPALAFGALFSKHIKSLLGSPMFMGAMFLLGGIVLLFVDDYFAKNERNTNKSQEMAYPTAFKIGLFQVLAIILPGISRSAATIIGGLTQGLTRAKAAEFAFFLAVPTMGAATLKDLYDYYKEEVVAHQTAITSHQLSILAVGSIIAFAVAFFAIRTFIAFLSKNGFKAFGYYRIIAGLIILFLGYQGIIKG
jgi:undecaprenyl-diphosphatase